MNDMILILNYSDEFSIEIARRLRAEQVHSRIFASDTPAEKIRELAPRGVILGGGASGRTGTFDAGILTLGIPVLALGHTAHMLLTELGGACAGVSISKKKASVRYGRSALFTGLNEGERYFEEALTLMLPPDVRLTADAAGCTVAFEDEEKKLYGVQFELERNDPEGSAILKNFARDICGCSAWWSHEAAKETAERILEDAASDGSLAICAVSGGVDSTLAALLAHRAFGERMTAFFVNTGLLRTGEEESVRALFDSLGIPLKAVDCSAEIMRALEQPRSMEEKRVAVVGIIESLLLHECGGNGARKKLVLGTNYSDFLHSGSRAAYWRDNGVCAVEPLLELFKDEVRAIAALTGMGEEIVSRKPFPALGLGARILGRLTPERLRALRSAEAIFSDEIRQAGLNRKLYKYFPILAGADSSIGMEMVILRAVTQSGGMLMPARLPYDLVERTVQRIREDNPGIGRVFYDQTPTPEGEECFF